VSVRDANPPTTYVSRMTKRTSKEKFAWHERIQSPFFYTKWIKITRHKVTCYTVERRPIKVVIMMMIMVTVIIIINYNSINATNHESFLISWLVSWSRNAPAFMETERSIFCFHKSLSLLVSCQNQLKPTHNFTPYFFKIRFNIVFHLRIIVP
jgi:hypothetical protein